MKVKFYYSNGFCGCDEEEVVDFPSVTDINDPKIDNYGEGSYQTYMESYMDDRFIDYPDKSDFESEYEYDDACNAAEEEYFENGEWWCKEYNDTERSDADIAIKMLMDQVEGLYMALPQEC